MDTTTNNSNLNPPILEDSASKSKFCIKIKIPTTTTREEEEDGSHGGVGGSSSHNFQLQPGQLGYRVCEFCGKEFTSGKAWGGHKRHHLKMMKNSGKRIQDISNNNIKIKKYSSSGGCGPGGRDGGGVESKIVSRGGCNMIKAGDVIMGSDGKPTCCLCGEVFGSLNSLFGHMRFHPDRDWKGIQPPPSSNSPTQSFPFTCSRFGLNQIQNQNQNQNLNQICSGSDDTKNIDLLSSLSSGWSKRDKRGRVGLSDLIPQAAHSLLTLSRDIAMDNETSGSAAAADQAHETEEEEALESSFQCDICEKTFPTGQALGGHKRCHWKAPAKPPPPPLLSNDLVSAASNTASSEEAIQAGHGMLGIDLNKPYIMQDGEEEDEESFNDED